ncbi:AAA family ATPase [Ramlibacter terrae]|uniref:AAA family ATPase n=1 Tax=Ramlibacter terrae TaxID=2732511 RepID=A0ABX6P0S8_9BURK|nr:AAA family ATPase [Ramlibacter terrae]
MNVSLQDSHDVALSVRIGIHTGLVLLSNLGQLGRERFALGETPNLASRVQGLAGVGEVLVSDSTRMLARAEFDFADLGEHQLKGIARPVRVFRALAARAAAGRPDAGLRTPLVGREPELALLRDRWSLAAEGHGRAVMVRGEPGIGKSRLVAAHRHYAESLGAQRVTLRCSPYHSASVLHPVIEHLARLLGFTAGMADAERLQRLQEAIALVEMDPATVPLFAALLGCPCRPKRKRRPRCRRARCASARSPRSCAG